METENTKPSPWLYIITLYLPFGILSGVMSQLPQSFFKLLGFSNQIVGVLSGIGIIASLRFLYAPWLDGATTKRRLSIITLSSAGVIMLAIAALIYAQPRPAFLLWGMSAMLILMTFSSASHETAADGYYIRALDPQLQAQFIGIKTSAIRIGTLSVGMGLLWGAAKIAAHYGAVKTESADKTGFYIGFSSVYILAGALMLLFALWNKYMVPVIPQDQPVKHTRFALKEVLMEYFQQKRVVLILLVILFYRFGEGFLQMKVPFFLDQASKGGIGMPASTLPFYILITGTPWTILGGILGGYIVKWFGLRKTFIPLALLMNLPNFFYAWMAWARPAGCITLFGEQLNTALLIGASVESLGYGISFSAIFYYMHISATLSGRNKTSILAISLCFMNLGYSIPMMLSGFVQTSFGYINTFILSSVIGLLAIPIIPFLPMPDQKQTGKS